MPGPFTDFAYNTYSTYAFTVGVGVLLSMAFCVWALRDVAKPGRVVDVALGAMIGGLLCSRAVHVALQWTYFDLHRAEITQIDAGGLDWRGAVIGVALGAAVLARLRGVPSNRLFDALALCLPLMAICAWVGSGAAHAVYGAEVARLTDYPAWLVWEERDIFNTIAPRYATQRLGAWTSAGLLALALLLHWRGWLRGQRAGLLLALTALMMFGIGFLRGDFAVMVGGLRQGQWLDLGLMLAGLVMVFWPRTREDQTMQHGYPHAGK